MTKSRYDLDSLGLILFVSSIFSTFVAFFVLVFGLGQLGYGHGTATLWYIGLPPHPTHRHDAHCRGAGSGRVAGRLGIDV